MKMGDKMSEISDRMERLIKDKEATIAHLEDVLLFLQGFNAMYPNPKIGEVIKKVKREFEGYQNKREIPKERLIEPILEDKISLCQPLRELEQNIGKGITITIKITNKKFEEFFKTIIENLVMEVHECIHEQCQPILSKKIDEKGINGDGILEQLRKEGIEIKIE